MPFRCDYCQRLFKHKRSRDRHVKLHTGDKRYRCCHCESAFSRSDHLKIHMKTHDHMKPFQCAICNRGYNTAAALTSHMQNHKRNNSLTNVGNVSNSNLNNNSINNGSANNNDNKSGITTSKSSMRQENRGQTPTNKVSDIVSRNSTSPTNNSQTHADSQQIQLTCGFCGIKCVSLENHIRQAHLHHLLFAGLLQNSFCQPSLPNWQSLMPPPPIPALTPANDLLQLHSGLTNGSISPPSPKKARISKSPSNPALPSLASLPAIASASSTPSSPQQTPLPLLCNQCSPSPAFHDFESFRVHLKSHLIASQHQSVHQLSIHHNHQCPYCGDSMGADFEAHLLNCHMGTVNTNYGCECCNKMFAKPDELQKHLMDIHAHHLYQCSLCRDMFDSKVSIQVHFAVKHSNECKIYKCNLCGELWNSEHEFKLHVKLVHFQPQSQSAIGATIGASFPLFGAKAYYRCKYCSEEFNIEYLLERHIDIEHSHQSQKLIKSGISGELERTASLVNSEKSRQQQKRTANHLKCEFCSSNNFRNASELEAHIKAEHKSVGSGVAIANNGNSKINNKCNICDELFASISELAEHKLKKHCMFGDKQCLECHAKINTKDDYMKHFVEHNNVNNSTEALNALFPVPCVVCKQTLMSEVEIDLHARYHSDSAHAVNTNANTANRDVCSPVVSESALNSLKYDCDSNNCNNSCSPKVEHNSSDAKRDESVLNTCDNITIKRYQCIKCQESYESEADIKNHVHQHMMNEGSNECKLCNKDFDTPAKLQCHLIEHNFNGGDEYSCHLCSITLNSSQLLQGHMFDEHHNDRPYSCEQCLQKFWFPTELDNHSIVEHNDSENDNENDNECHNDSHNDAHNCDNGRDKCSQQSNADNGKDDTFKCVECGKQFPHKRHLKLHLKSSHHHLKHHFDNQSVTNEKRFACAVCGKKFARKEIRKLHYKSHHQ